MNKIVWGVSALSHDASLSVVKQQDGQFDRLMYASHAERYSRKKNDSKLHPLQIQEALDNFGRPSMIYWFEDSIKKRLRYLTSGMIGEAFSLDNSPKRHLRELGLDIPLVMGSHHHSHAAAVYYTRPTHWDGEADVLVVDAIGEYDTITTWTGSEELRMVGKPTRYPQSLGLFYTAVTQYVGLKPDEEEYILMGMAAFGEVVPGLAAEFCGLLDDGANFHRGLLMAGLDDRMLTELKHEDIAATAQYVVEARMVRLAKQLRARTHSRFLCLAGGVALNCVANTKIAERAGYEEVWIMPNPGDAGASLGAILQHTQRRVHFNSPFLGTHIPPVASSVTVVDHLIKYKVAGLARGRAEWGPRALGNRSLLGDPRKAANKDLVNTIKKRQKFRPFAPIVLAEQAREYFDLPAQVLDMQYMQYTVKCIAPSLVPAVVHADGTSRVQVISPGHPLRPILEEWYARTGCPVLLNTSLNVKGEPLVNTRSDANAFERKNKIKVFT